MKVFFIPNNKSICTRRVGVFKPKQIVPFLEKEMRKQKELMEIHAKFKGGEQTESKSLS